SGSPCRACTRSGAWPSGLLHELDPDAAVLDLHLVLAQAERLHGEATPGRGIKAVVVPQAGEHTVLHLVIADRTPKMRANVGQRLDSAVVAKHEEVMVIHPLRELAVGLELGEGSNALERSLGLGCGIGERHIARRLS